MICDICGERITGDYYEMPDGLTVCEECLEDWAANYSRFNEVSDE